MSMNDINFLFKIIFSIALAKTFTEITLLKCNNSLDSDLINFKKLPKIPLFSNTSTFLNCLSGRREESSENKYTSLFF